MNIGILYFKKDNTIHDFFSNVKAVSPSKVEYENGGCVEGFAVNGVNVIVVDTLITKYEEEKQQNYLEDSQGNKYTYGDRLPEGLVDLSEQFKKPTIEELQNKTIILSEELDHVKQENTDLKSENLTLFESVATVYEKQLNSEMNNAQAIAELYELIIGGQTS